MSSLAWLSWQTSRRTAEWRSRWSFIALNRPAHCWGCASFVLQWGECVTCVVSISLPAHASYDSHLQYSVLDIIWTENECFHFKFDTNLWKLKWGFENICIQLYSNMKCIDYKHTTPCMFNYWQRKCYIVFLLLLLLLDLDPQTHNSYWIIN